MLTFIEQISFTFMALSHFKWVTFPNVVILFTVETPPP